jgi:hypothetical protein
VNPTGTRPAARNSEQNVVDVWDLDALRALPAIPSDAQQVVGFSDELVVLGGNSIELWRPDPATLLGDTSPDLGTPLAVHLHGDTVVSATGRNPEPEKTISLVLTLPLDAKTWFHRLCQIKHRSWFHSGPAAHTDGSARHRYPVLAHGRSRFAPGGRRVSSAAVKSRSFVDRLACLWVDRFVRT